MQIESWEKRQTWMEYLIKCYKVWTNEEKLELNHTEQCNMKNMGPI